MIDLGELQRELSGYLLGRHDLAKDPEAVRFAEQHLCGSERLSPVEHLEIYREQFWLRHTQSLLEDFPGVSALLGQADWERLVEGYLPAHPPSSFSLRDVGAKLPSFIRDSATWLEQQALVFDMAQLEWAYIDIFDAAEPDRLAPETLSALGEEGLATAGLTLSPCLRLLGVSFPVEELRKRLLSDSDETLVFPALDPHGLVLYRASLALCYRRLEPAAFALLQALQNGQSLSDACEAACALGEAETVRVSECVGAWLADWVQLKWVTGVRSAAGSGFSESS